MWVRGCLRELNIISGPSLSRFWGHCELVLLRAQGVEPEGRVSVCISVIHNTVLKACQSEGKLFEEYTRGGSSVLESYITMF